MQDSMSSNFEYKKNLLSRKDARKACRKQKKISNALHYAKSKNTNKVCISADDLKQLKVLKNKTSNDQNTKIFSSLKDKILTNDNNKNITLPKSKKNKKQNVSNKNFNQNRQKENFNEDTSSSFKLSGSTNSRLSQLQEYVNQEVKKITEQPKKVNDRNGKLKTENLIKDKYKVKELMQGQGNDQKEINKFGRKLHLNAHQKKNIYPAFQPEFGDILEDIEKRIFDESKCKDITNYDADNFENDILSSLGKVKLKKDDRLNCNAVTDLSDDDEECYDIENDGETDASDEENELNHNNNFLDDEAEESENDETDGESEDGENELMFESGSCLSSTQTSTKSTRPSINTIFDLYTKNSDEEEEDDESDLDGFIVDDDFVEYTDEYNKPVKKGNKTKKSRIINRERLDSGDSDIMDIDTENESNKCKRRRILSESECEDVQGLDEVSKKESFNNDLVSSKKVCDIGNELDVQKSILKKNCDLNDSKPNKKKQKKGKKNKDKDDGKPKKRVSFTLPEDDGQNLNDKENGEQYSEDIYGRLKDKSGNLVNTEINEIEVDGKYIPPAVRKLMALNNDAQKKEQLAHLRKKLKGQFNRLAESNMAGILSQIEMCYQFNSRNDVNDTMTKLLFEMLVTPVMTQEKLIQDHALLIAVMSANVGNEVGAHILTEFVVKWVEDLENFKPTENMNEIDSKELDNTLMFICQLYNFKVVDSSLIYDILHKLLNRHLNPKEVDLIVLILRSVGFALRKDNSIALKSLITVINVKANEVSSEQDVIYSRVKFMLEILTAIRNNSMNKVPNYDPTHSQHLKQLMKGFIRKGCRTSELKISLEDLLKSKIVGKWWIVGSAWSGGLKENLSQNGGVGERTTGTSVPSKNNDYSDKFKKKAAKLQMTRPPRINILYVITEGAANYDEAFEGLIELRLPKSQEQEIFNVLIFCCLRCKTYVQLYNNVAMKLIQFKREYIRLLQFSIWDRFKELDDMKPKYAANLAKFVANLIAENGLNMLLFNNLNFEKASEGTVSFLRQVFLGIFLHSTGNYAVSNSFRILCNNDKLKLRQYIRLFIIKFIRSYTYEEKAMDQLLKSRVKLALHMLTSVGGAKL